MAHRSKKYEIHGAPRAINTALETTTRPTGRRKRAPGPRSEALLSWMTDIGVKRENNEDSVFVMDKRSLPGLDALLVVADGMGGHRAGEVASGMAVDIIRSCASLWGSDRGSGLAVDWKDRLEQAALECNRRIYQAGRSPVMAGMGTTLTVAVIEKDTLHLAHVGDSRAYLLSSSGLRQLSIDHTYLQEAQNQGILTQGQLNDHPDKGVLTRAVGPYPRVEVDSDSYPLNIGDTVLICSDGLHSVVPDDVIKEILGTGSPETIARSLIDQANANSGPDNISVAIAHLVASSNRRRKMRSTRTLDVGNAHAETKVTTRWNGFCSVCSKISSTLISMLSVPSPTSHDRTAKMGWTNRCTQPRSNDDT